MNSKAKGKRFELELAHMLKDEGFEARRTAQYCGNTGDASDVVGLPGIHIEAKHYASIAFKYEWMEQAKRDSKGTGNVPAVFHKTDRHPVLVTMEFDDWIRMYKEAKNGK